VTGGYVASAVLAVSGLAGVVDPQRIGQALQTDLSPARARAEYRIVYGTLAALGVGALVAGSSDVFTAIGTVWLGAAAVRVLALALDRPKADLTYWAYLALELALGFAAVLENG